jgi:heavy metal translocating P-type ATPase
VKPFDRNRFNLLQAGLSAACLAAGFAALLAGHGVAADWIWSAGAGLVLAGVLADTVSALRQGRVGVDLIAVASLLGALALSEQLAAAVIALMFASGRALETYAEGRAEADMAALLARAPRAAFRYEDGGIRQVALDAVRPGDRLAVRPGDTVPVDGSALGPAVIDESSLTGESLPVTCEAGAALRSGAVNAGGAFDLLATGTAEASTFSQIIRLVNAARAERAPAARLADRYALMFVPLAFGVAILAWLLSGDPRRALAVLVVATPCPLILAVPVAIVGAMSRCARQGVLVKHGGALEKLAQARTIFFDKTGTLTGGRAHLVEIAADPQLEASQVLAWAASLEQLSNHAIAQAVVGAAAARGLALSLPEEVGETPGAGLCGRVEGRSVRVGTLDYVAPGAAPPAWAAALVARTVFEGAALVAVGVDGRLCGVLQMADEIRPDAPRAIRQLRAAGVERVVMLTGDRRDVAHTIARLLGIETVLPEQTPASKLQAIAAARAEGVTVMVGDGVNDAPALAAADVGVAMGARGAAAAAESAQVVLLADRLDRLALTLRVAQRTRRIALQSVVGGMGASGVAMLLAAFGYLPPVAGALLQELIDVAAILNALRVLRLGAAVPAGAFAPAEGAALREEHARLMPVLDRLRWLADRIDELPEPQARAAVAELDAALRERILPHEARDDAELYPRVARAVGGEDPMAPLSSVHREIYRLGRALERLAGQADIDGPARLELRRTLYALDAVLRLHFAQEEELFHNLSA